MSSSEAGSKRSWVVLLMHFLGAWYRGICSDTLAMALRDSYAMVTGQHQLMAAMEV